MTTQIKMVNWGMACLWLAIGAICPVTGFARQTVSDKVEAPKKEKAVKKIQDWLAALSKKDPDQMVSNSGFPFFVSGIGRPEKPCAQGMGANSKEQFARLADCLFTDDMLLSEIKELGNAKDPMNSLLGEAKNWKVITPEEAVSQKFITKFQAKWEKRDFASLFKQLSVGENRILVNAFFLGPIGTAWQFLFAVEPSGDRLLVVGVVAYNQPYE